MFIRKSTHETVVRELNEGHRAEIAALQAKVAGLATELRTEKAVTSALDKTAARYRADLATANAELETLRAGKAKRVANLTAANKARKEAAAANRAGADLAGAA